MSKLKLMSVLQSRIANNRNLLRYLWEEYNDYEELCFYSKEVKTRAIIVGERQKEDKAILKQLIEDERELKKWKARFGRYAKLPPIEGDLIVGMREGR